MYPITPDPNRKEHSPLFRLLGGFNSWLNVLSLASYRLPISTLEILGSRIVLINSAELIRRMKITRHHSYPRHGFLRRFLGPLVGSGLFTSDGEKWARDRKIIEAVFRDTDNVKLTSAMNRATSHLIERIEQVPSGNDFELEGQMSILAAEVILTGLLRVTPEPHDLETILRSFKRYRSRTALAFILSLLRCDSDILLSILLRDAAKIRHWINDIITTESRLEPNPTNALDQKIKSKSLLLGHELDHDELLDQVTTIFLAGQETTAAALALVCYLLSHNPAVQQKCRQEIKSALSCSANVTSCPHAKDQQLLHELHYTTSVIKEVLRLYPPIPFLLHESHDHEAIGDKKCPLSSIFVVSPWIMHRKPSNWLDPHLFMPDRFLPPNTETSCKNPSSLSYMPFGIGPRICPGKNLAMQEMQIVISRLLLNYNILPSKAKPPKLVSQLTLRSSNGVFVRFEPL